MVQEHVGRFGSLGWRPRWNLPVFLQHIMFGPRDVLAEWFGNFLPLNRQVFLDTIHKISSTPTTPRFFLLKGSFHLPSLAWQTLRVVTPRGKRPHSKHEEQRKAPTPPLCTAPTCYTAHGRSVRFVGTSPWSSTNARSVRRGETWRRPQWCHKRRRWGWRGGVFGGSFGGSRGPFRGSRPGHQRAVQPLVLHIGVIRRTRSSFDVQPLVAVHPPVQPIAPPDL